MKIEAHSHMTDLAHNSQSQTNRRAFAIWALVAFLPLMIGTTAVGETNSKAKAKSTRQKATNHDAHAKQVSTELTPASEKNSILNTPIRKPSTLDPNSAVEIRGQARTLSMMLVLKNGKDAINFIKVRKDYRPEISNTEF